MRRGNSFVELMVAMVLLVLVIVALMLGRVGPTWSVFDPLTGGAPEAGALEQEMRKVVAEIQAATRITFPFAGVGSRGGLGLITADGATVLYYLEPSTVPGRPGSLVRTDLTAVQAGREQRPQTLVADVRTLRVAVAPAAPGKQPSLVDMDVAVEVMDRSTKNTRTINFVTSAFVRNLEQPVPDDLFPAGTPLQDP